MSPVTNLWRQLVQRRLWPVAIVLIAALAAVPLTLAEEPAPAPAPAPAPPVTEDELAVAPIVTAVSAEDRTERRRVLGSAKNPFAVAKPAKRVVATNSADDVAAAPKPERDDEPAATGGPATPPATGGSTPVATVDPGAETPAPAEKTYGKEDIAVRFGDASAGSVRKTLKRLQALPSSREPVLIYLGLLKDGKTAEFLLDHGVEAIGDGECRPNADACERIRLRAGETEFVDVTDEAGTVVGQYQLDFVKALRPARTSGAKATATVVGARAALVSSP